MHVSIHGITSKCLCKTSLFGNILFMTLLNKTAFGMAGQDMILLGNFGWSHRCVWRVDSWSWVTPCSLTGECIMGAKELQRGRRSFRRSIGPLPEYLFPNWQLNSVELSEKRSRRFKVRKFTRWKRKKIINRLAVSMCYFKINCKYVIQNK